MAVECGKNGTLVNHAGFWCVHARRTSDKQIVRHSVFKKWLPGSSIRAQEYYSLLINLCKYIATTRVSGRFSLVFYPMFSASVCFINDTRVYFYLC